MPGFYWAWHQLKILALHCSSSPGSHHHGCGGGGFSFRCQGGAVSTAVTPKTDGHNSVLGSLSHRLSTSFWLIIKSSKIWLFPPRRVSSAKISKCPKTSSDLLLTKKCHRTQEGARSSPEWLGCVNGPSRAQLFNRHQPTRLYCPPAPSPPPCPEDKMLIECLSRNTNCICTTTN